MQEKSQTNDQPVIKEKTSRLKKVAPTLAWTGAIVGSTAVTVGASLHQLRIAKMALETAKLNHATALLKKAAS